MKISAQTFETGDFINIFSFRVFETHFLINIFLIKKLVEDFTAIYFNVEQSSIEQGFMKNCAM